MLFPRCEERPAHVPEERVYDYDVFDVDAPDGDFARALYRLREDGAPPLFWTPANKGHWVATDGTLIETILSSPNLFSSRAMRVPKESNPATPIIPLMIDPPRQLKYRILLLGAMSPATVKRIAPDVRALCVRIIEELKPQGRCEFVQDFAQQMPIAIFLSLLDLGPEDQPEVMAIVDRIIRPDVPATRMRGFDDLNRFTTRKVEERRLNPGNDLITQLTRAEIDGVPVTATELQGLMTVLLLAGLDTVAGMLGFIAAFLARNPGHRQRLRDDPALIPSAVEEFLRRMSMTNLTREVTQDQDVGGVTLRAGELVVLPVALANLSDKYERPLDVDLDRKKPRHATFGIGPHSCMGAMLARTEIAIFLEEWLQRIPDFEIAPDATLEVRVGAAAMIPSLPLIWAAG